LIRSAPAIIIVIGQGKGLAMIWDFWRNFGAGIAHSGWGLLLLVLGIVAAVWGALYFTQASEAGRSQRNSGSSKGWLFIVFAVVLVVVGAFVTAQVGSNYAHQAGQQAR
jgi:threonine/homoserine/homoserine lactone efflux protein